jgi:hypothetical protein
MTKGNWVGGSNARLGRTADRTSKKKYRWEYEMSQKGRRMNTGKSKQKRKKKIKIEKDFWAVENWKFDSNGF